MKISHLTWYLNCVKKIVYVYSYSITVYIQYTIFLGIYLERISTIGLHCLSYDNKSSVFLRHRVYLACTGNVHMPLPCVTTCPRV